MAAVDYFLKIKGIEGESTDAKHKKEIEALSWSWGVTNSGSHASGAGGGAGKAVMREFNFTMRVSKATPLLVEACYTGNHLPEAVLTVRKAGGQQQEYLVIKFADLIVSSYQTGGQQGGVIPVDHISMNFAKIEYSYKPQKKDGTLDSPVKVGYDIKANKKL
jgi:type VI secretion system secreted protein Hcp